MKNNIYKKALIVTLVVLLSGFAFSSFIGTVNAVSLLPEQNSYNERVELSTEAILYDIAGLTFYETIGVDYTVEYIGLDEYVVSYEISVSGLRYNGRAPATEELLIHHSDNGPVVNGHDETNVYGKYIYHFDAILKGTFDDFYWWTSPWSKIASFSGSTIE